MHNLMWGVQPGEDCKSCTNVYLEMRTIHTLSIPGSKELLSDLGHHLHEVGKCSYCTGKVVQWCEYVWAAPGSVCSVAVQRPAHSQSSHLPGDRREIEAVFAQLTPSHSQDKHTALYAQHLPFTPKGAQFPWVFHRFGVSLTHTNNACMNSVCVTYSRWLPSMLG